MSLKLPVLSVVCPSCRGRGVAFSYEGDMAKCPACGGSGRSPLKVRRQPFDYVFPSFAYTQAGTIVQELQLDDDTYFEHTAWVLAYNYSSNPIYATTTLQMLDESTGWNFSNAPIALPNFASGPFALSGGAVPGSAFGASVLSPLLVPYVWYPGALAQATLVVPGAGADTVILTMKGFKLYDAKGNPISQIPSQEAA